jgi:HAE1 family hydrophobic/amphiphilic exporter-1
MSEPQHNPIARLISRPVAVTVGVILVVLLGAVSLFKLPIQLTPEVVKPEITVSTNWRGASPLEVEREVITRQEEVLKGVPGLVELTSESQDGRGQVMLTFRTGTDLETALVRVANRLDQVKDFPDLADRPVLSTVNVNRSAIAWLILKTTAGNDTPIDSYRNLAENIITARFERIPGVAQSNVFGGWERELQVIVDADAMAARDVTLADLARVLDRENADYTAGQVDAGKRSLTVRITGAYKSPEDLDRIVLPTGSGAPLFLGDLATIRIGYKKPQRSVRQNGEAAVAVNVVRESGSNTLDIMAELREAVTELNAGPLAQRILHIEQVYDESLYITRSIDQVQTSLIVGGALAIMVLLLFLRSFTSTIVVATAIPISVIGTFGVLYLLDRNLNVVSLAGMCFAIGMVVDAAIVVLENIYRHREAGASRRDAALKGMSEVWGAVLASTLTTVAVFLPILFLEVEAGQMFRDIAIAITCGVTLSLIVSVTVIPTFAARILGSKGGQERGEQAHQDQATKKASQAGGPAARWIADKVQAICARTSTRLGVLALVALGLTGVAYLMPEAEYLPEGNRNLVLGILLPPPGYNVDEITQIGHKIEADLAPLWETDQPEVDGKPAVSNFFYVASGSRVFMGARTRDPDRIRDLMPVMRESLGQVPGMIALVFQSSIFARGLGSGRSVDVEFTGPDLEQLVALGGRTFGMVRGVMEGAQVRPKPSLDIGNPEIRVVPDRLRASAVGLPLDDLGITLSALVDGATVSTFPHEGEEIDLTLYAGDPAASSKPWRVVSGAEMGPVAKLPIRTASGATITLDAVSQVWETSGPTQVNHVERQRTVTISAVPPESMSLQAAMETITEKVIGPLKSQGMLSPPYSARLTGTADELSVTMGALKWNVILAVAIVFLLMAALFESFLYALVIMIAVPTAAAGGVLGIMAVNAWVAPQRLDILTMLGFVILVGIVVNNAILIVHQTLIFIRTQAIGYQDALTQAVRVRVRPIFMSTLTTVFGMIPLVTFTGPGSELYRGIGSVVVGGLLFSTLFTLVLVPVLFSLLMDAKAKITGEAGTAVEEAD